ncbi:MAG: hypothetical protein ABMA26_26370 [Limisphaerales bacterium]
MSLINDALKRAAESQGQAQAQAQARPRGPKGIEDLPVPMTPVSARERPAWLPVLGIGLLAVALLGASGFFFAKWWKEQKAWQPYVETPPDDDPATNAVAQGKSPPDTKQAKANTKLPPVTPPAATNPVVKTNVEVAVVPPPKPVIPEPPAPKATNPVVPVVVPPSTQPDPVVPKTVVNPPPPVTPPTNPPPVVIPPPVKPPADTAKKAGDHTKLAAVEFPELKLQGIIRGKKKTTAIVNGKMLSLGDRLEGAFLLKIEQESVTFEKGSVRRELFLLR